ncbi:hypothetical protein MTO96_047359, partial [Rhipicephalus appendiculatus]
PTSSEPLPYQRWTVIQASKCPSWCDYPTLLYEASEILLQGTLPPSADLQGIIDGLRDKDSALVELDKQIVDVHDEEESGEKIKASIQHHKRIAKTSAWLSVEYVVVLHRVPKHSLPGDQVIPHRKRTKIDTDAVGSAGQSREDQVKFIQEEVKSR